MVSFKNYVALANFQKRIQDTRNIVWRDKEHAATGGFRSAALAFNIRSSFNLLLALIKMRKVPRAQWLALLRHALFGSDSFRFGAMFGTFTALYKILLNALPLLIPATQTSPHGLSSASRKRTRRWHSALAGTISGGLAVLWEKRSRRSDIAQQIFVRGLHGTYNNYSEKWGINIPYGAVIVFSLSCAQIAYACFLRPDTLPRSYVSWLRQAIQIPPESFKFNIKAVQEHVVDIPALDRLIARSDVTPTNLSSLLSLRERALSGTPDLPRYLPCHGLHPGVTSCRAAALEKFVQGFRWMLPTYSALYFVRSIFFRWTIVCADPAGVLGRATVATMRSSAFLGVSGALWQAVLCIKHGLYEHLMAAPASSPLRKLLPQPLIDMLIHPTTWLLCGLSTGLPLLIEDRRRYEELAVYCLPKAIESLWLIARGHGLIFRTGNWGEGVLAGVGMGMVMTIYQNDPHHLSGLVRKILYQFLGPN
ncbi:hypothetical protein B0H17DRAFT_1197260 [Mycena rosella]|uniref:Transmembrane protein 135 N-terminal domain-containing protein n=1 Tax=Mycena rosella TaxID=1033263 RepID=A0AAD7GNM8_MYCRO|nr:hypothetical protein B0H17DRAFT_1197260 [Mycena rosella]